MHYCMQEINMQNLHVGTDNISLYLEQTEKNEAARWWPKWCAQYRDLLLTGWSGILTLVRARFSRHIQTGLNAHQASCITSTRSKSNKHQLDAILCRFYFCRVTLHVLGASPSSGVFKTGTAATGTCVIVAVKSSYHLIRAEFRP